VSWHAATAVVDPAERGVVGVGVRVEMDVTIILAQTLQLQPAIDQNLVAFTDLGMGELRLKN
jgi:hypothetical protein